MKSYLELVPLSAKVHKQQNRMTRLCIAISVFLVTAIFSMADMMLRLETDLMIRRHGEEDVRSFFERPSVQTTLPIMAVLFLLILLAGVFMIAGSMNSGVSRRTRYYGMLRCIGMSRSQVIGLVRLEALEWCKNSIPAGLISGIITSWGLCAFLKYIVRDEFSSISVFGFSLIAVGFGVLVGLVTVLIAAGAPARKAAAVSPISAVRNETGQARTGISAAGKGLKIETGLGISHAVNSGKNLFLVSGSFGLSIVLFLCFSVFITLINYLMPQSSGEGHLEIRSAAKGNAVSAELIGQIEGIHGVERVYGRRSLPDIPAEAPGIREVDLISFDPFELENLQKDGLLKKGSDVSEVIGDSGQAYLISEDELPKDAAVSVNGHELHIAGQLKYDIFSEDGMPHGRTTLIVSDDAFTKITGTEDYQLVMIRLTGDASDEDVRAIDGLLDEDLLLSDRREDNSHGTYLAFLSCVYAFLAVIALVAALNVVNCISMGLSAKIREFGMMRAVGMDQDQLVRMVRAESLTYACGGCLAGLALGLPLTRWIYGILITEHFAYAPVWSLPLGDLAVILVFILISAYAGTVIPMSRIRKMTVIGMTGRAQ